MTTHRATGTQRKGARSGEIRPPQSRFGVLVSLQIRHDYFNADADVCRAIDVRPTPETVRRLKQHGMSVLARGDGFDLLVSQRSPNEAGVRAPTASGRAGHGAAGPGGERAAVRRALSAGPPLLFTMALRDGGFSGYTDMPVHFLPGDPPLRWSNRGAERSGDGRALIAPDWPVAAAQGRAADAEPCAAGDAQAERAAYARAWRQFGLFDLHLPPWGSGDGAGLVAPDLSAALAGPASEPLVYELRFAARRTVWRYVVAARAGELAEEPLEIVEAAAPGGGSARAAFRKLAARRQLPDGRTAVVFAGRSAVPLRQRPEHRYALRGLPLGGHMRQRTLVDPLPAPSPRATVFDVDARSSAPPDGSRPAAAPWSDIYVFV